MAESPLILIALLLLAAGAAYAAYEWRRIAAAHAIAERELAGARVKLEQIDALRGERDAAVVARNAAEGVAAHLRAELAGERGGAEARAVAVAEREQALLAMKGEVERSFVALAQQALAANEQRFLTLANQTFETHKTAAAGGVKEAVAPVAEQFQRLSESIAALDKARTEDKSALFEQMRQVGEAAAQTQREAGRLANALRAAPKARGRWGEQGLRNILELSGLTHQIDFQEQQSHDTETGKARPDVIIKVPGGRCVVVDSKVALSAYLDASEATDDLTRAALMKKHAQEMRAHMKGLASKEYAKHVPDTADFVVMFVPGENFLAAALEHDPDLFREGWDNKVILVGPASLLALAKSISYGWKQEEVAQNAAEIATIGAQLHDRLGTMAERIAKLGDTIGKAVTHYNDLVGTVESRVFPAARRFKELRAGDADIVRVEQQDLSPRQLTLAIEEELGKPRKRIAP